MFCPVCKAEYRLGFTHCSDCDVDLVENPADTLSGEASPEQAEPVALLWTGTDSGLQGAICDALDKADISYHRRFRQLGPLPGLPEAVYAILVHPRDLERAKAPLGNIYRQIEIGDAVDQHGMDGSTVEDAGAGDGGDEDAPDDIVHDFNPEDATEEIWAGRDSQMAQTLRVCLQENGIGCVVEDVDDERAVFVTPDLEARAREIVRQIVEAAPPA
ncbi:MAG TPA: hypothetical protein VEJ67_10715 [Candidatus Cybelea sp.]|nr:hypothetical protein [Candidatus Cybelea sp.]